ncbi:metalloproteinase inhibitor 2-like [Dunckerocampus dactyliophorus]|uniref:metalloproteinase inhibitor 2-like n=1 Tax=Dunckerocampus dactyliophorus TaxID=161453 RepID=UPI002406B86F|nr:metalloproteinase inhibitor 2-like [Dunckerocampus dactyliophorus]
MTLMTLVIKVKVGKKTNGDFGKPTKYDLKLIKMFKGPKKNIDAVYTPSSPAACGKTLTTGVDYLITGKLASDGSLHITLCDFIAPWKSLCKTQKNNLVQGYKMGCNCKITRCTSLPCKISSRAECSWTDFVMKSDNRQQAKHFACIKRRDGSCTWYSGGASRF